MLFDYDFIDWTEMLFWRRVFISFGSVIVAKRAPPDASIKIPNPEGMFSYFTFLHLIFTGVPQGVLYSYMLNLAKISWISIYCTKTTLVRKQAYVFKKSDFFLYFEMVGEGWQLYTIKKLIYFRNKITERFNPILGEIHS